METLVSGITAGAMIGFGGTCFLSMDNKVLGAVLFALGLYIICVKKEMLYTGQVSYHKEIPFLLLILAGNYIGAAGIGLLIRYIKPGVVNRALAMAANKSAEGLLVIPLGICCNIMIYFAVEGFKNNQPILLIMCVAAFILCGFEHCIANMFYFAVAGKFFSPYILLNIAGNTLGGILVQFIEWIRTKIMQYWAKHEPEEYKQILKEIAIEMETDIY